MSRTLGRLLDELGCNRGGTASSGAVLVVICCLVAATGCDRDGVEEHAVAKGVERMPDVDSVPSAPGETTAGVARSGRPWVVPAGWVEAPEQRPMRLATYTVPVPAGPVEVAVSRFAGRVGGDLANVNRWRGQMGLPPIGAGELDETLVRFSAPGYDGYQTRIEAPTGVMLAAGVYDASIDQMWFVRATVGESDEADRIQADLFGMARSIAGLDNEGDD